jgi:hypothetical protein
LSLVNAPNTISNGAAFEFPKFGFGLIVIESPWLMEIAENTLLVFEKLASFNNGVAWFDNPNMS